MTTIDYTPLTRTVSQTEVERFRSTARAQGTSTASTVAVVIIAVFVGLFLLAAFGFVTIFIVVAVVSGFGAFGIVPVVFGLLFVGGIGFAIYRAIRAASARVIVSLRLTEFAAANGMHYLANGTGPFYPGVIFSEGSARVTPDRLWRSEGRVIDIANYLYTTGSGDDKKAHAWGYLMITLDRKLPHMLLDAKANNFMGSNLPVAFRRDQVLSLEGDFDKHFTLYCPKEYERDALYVLTPDLMALLIDEAGAFDVEIIDDQLFVYSATPFNLANPAVWYRLFQIIDTVGAKAVTQTDAYADDRVGNATADVVAPRGQRLRRRIPISAVVVSVVVFGAFIAFFATIVANAFAGASVTP